MKRRLFLLLALIALMISTGSLYTRAKPGPPPQKPTPQLVTPPRLAGTVPAGLPSTFWLGVSSQPTDLAWMTGSGVPWNARYQYLTGGVNTGNGWAGWNTPSGQFATYYMTNSHNAGYIPVFTYYQLLPSNPHAGAGEPDQDFNNLNNATTMNAYYADFALLLQKAAAYGQPVVVHVEPDFWGYMEFRAASAGGSAANVSASVASSGYAGVAGYPNTVQGFAQALLHLRDSIAPNVIMAIHASHWAWGGADIGISNDNTINATQVGQTIGNFLLTAGINGNPSGTSSWNLVFTDLSDRDAAYYQYVVGDNGAHWWDLSNSLVPNFSRYRQYVAALNAATARRIVLWQLPEGNTVMRSENNTTGHYQDNRVQGLLGGTAPDLPNWINAGVIGLLWGAGQGDQTMPTDDQGDGITNPAPINGNNTTATVADDDGGYLRQQAAAYYSRGALALPPAACGTFNDVPASHWAYVHINWLACQGYVGGYSDGTFRPDNTATRAQFSKMLALGQGWPLLNPATPSFSDVAPGSTFYQYVETAKAHGVIGGYSDGTFRPGNEVSRGQISKMLSLARAWALVNPATPSFSDVPPGSTFYQYVETAKAHGIISGYGDGTFRPAGSATRAQLSKMLALALGGP